MRTLKQRVEGFLTVHAWAEGGRPGIRLRKPTTDDDTVEPTLSTSDPEEAIGVIRTWLHELVRRSQEQDAEDGRPEA